MPVLRGIADEQEYCGARKAVHETVKQRLGFRVGPVQIFENEQYRLDLALSKEQPLHPVERSLTSLLRVELLPQRIIRRNIEEGKKRRERGLEGPIQRHHHPGPFSAVFSRA